MGLTVAVVLTVGLIVLVSWATRSASVKPSWAVTKLMLADGRRPAEAYKSELPVKRVARSGRLSWLLRQYSRTSSRYSAFHSDHFGGKFPTW